MDHLPRSIRHPWGQAADAFDVVVQDGVRRMVRKLCLAPLESALVGTASYPTHRDVSNAVTEVLARLQVVPLRAMFSQAARLATAIESPDPWHALCAEFPDLTLAALALDDRPDARSELIALQSRYLREWQAFPASMTGKYFDDGRSAA